MPDITRTKAAAGNVLATVVTLGAGANALVFTPQVGQALVLTNPTGAPINCTIDGDGGSAVKVPGLGDVSVSSGYTFAVAAGATRVVWLDSIFEYLKGTISVTGENLEAMLLG